MAYFRGVYEFYSLKTAEMFRKCLEKDERIKTRPPIHNIALNIWVVGVSYNGTNEEIDKAKEYIENLARDVIEKHRQEFIKWNEQFK